jgi:hypothetical protein
MAVRSKIRPLVCVLLAVSFCVPMLAMGAPAQNCGSASEFRALAAPSSTILLTRGGARHDLVRHRSSEHSLFAVIPLKGAGSDPGRRAAAIEGRVPHTVRNGGPRTGRSPPPIS